MAYTGWLMGACSRALLRTLEALRVFSPIPPKQRLLKKEEMGMKPTRSSPSHAPVCPLQPPQFTQWPTFSASDQLTGERRSPLLVLLLGDQNLAALRCTNQVSCERGLQECWGRTDTVLLLEVGEWLFFCLKSE